VSVFRYTVVFRNLWFFERAKTLWRPDDPDKLRLNKSRWYGSIQVAVIRTKRFIAFVQLSVCVEPRKIITYITYLPPKHDLVEF